VVTGSDWGTYSPNYLVHTKTEFLPDLWDTQNKDKLETKNQGAIRLTKVYLENDC